MDDEADDYDMFMSTFKSHAKLIHKLMSNTWQSIPNLTSIAKHSLNSTFLVTIMRPQTFALIVLIIFISLVAHNFEYWFFTIASLIFKIVNKIASLFGINLPLYILGDGLSQDHIVEELSDKNVGVYAIQGRRPQMEDKFNYYGDKHNLGFEYWGIYDGHGGEYAAEYAHSYLYNLIEKRVKELKNFDNQIDGCEKKENGMIQGNKDGKQCVSPDKKKNQLTESLLSQIITEEVLSLDKRLIERAKETFDVSGSTAIIALKLTEQNKLLVANVGDSRGVICDAKGNAVPLSFDHKPQQIKEHKRIQEAGGFIKFNGVWRVAGILAISRALGDYPLKDNNFIIAEPDILTFDLNDMQPQFMILASDGLWDIFSNEEAINFIKNDIEKLKKSSSKEIALEAAKNIVWKAYRRGSLDNITVIIVLFENALKPS